MEKEIKEFTILLIVTLLIRVFVFQISFVPSGSMIPTIKINDVLFVNNLYYNINKEVKRFDIVVFNPPNKKRTQYIKRVIGLPSEELTIKNGTIYINDNEIVEDSYLYLKDTDNFDPIKIPKNHYFVMGDNRENSSDSRYWGLLPKNNINGKAIFNLNPFNHIRLIK